MIRKAFLAAGILGATLPGLPAAAAMFDFDDLTNGQLVTSVTAGGITASVSGTGGTGDVRAFDTQLPANVANDPDLVGTDFGGDLLKNDAGTALIVQSRTGPIPNDNARGGSITFMFDKMVHVLGFDLLDDLDITVSAPGKTPLSYSIAADGDFLSVGGAPIFRNVTQLTFTFEGSGAIDKLNVSAVPVPAALPLLVAGLGALGLAARRRKA